MKRKRHCWQCSRCTLLSLLILAGTLPVRGVSATQFFWDINGATAGAGGATPSGTWSTNSSTIWTTDGNGATANALNVTTGAADDLTFSAGTDASGSYTITVSGTQQARSMLLEDGLVTFSSGTINLNANSNLTVNSPAIGTENFNNPITIGTSGGTEGVSFTNNSSTAILSFNNQISASTSGTKTINFSGSGTTVLGSASIVTGGAGTVALVVGTFGSGSVTLSGGNSYTGGLTLNFGTLKLGSSSALGATPSLFTINSGTLDSITPGLILGNNPISINGSFTFTGTQNLTFGSGPITLGANPGTLRQINVSANAMTLGGVISNGTTANALVKAGTGTLTLTGANAFTGGLTLSGGTFKIGNASALGAATGTFQIEAGTTFDSILPNLVVANNNPLRFNGDFTFAGTNSLNLGTGAVSLGTTAGTSRQVTVSANTLTLGGIISNGTTANALTKAGNGTLVLTAANTYTGLTTISAGTLQLGNGTTSNGSVSGAITDSATLVFANPLAQTYAGVISGGGALTKSGGGVLTLTGANNFAGATTISAGTLQLGDGTTNNGSVTTNIIDNATLVFANPNAQTYAGIISGVGGLNKSGAGTLTLTGVSTYTGLTAVDGGTLLVQSGGGMTQLGDLSIGASGVSGLSGTFSLDGASTTVTQAGTAEVTIGAASTTTGTLNIGTTTSIPLFASGSGLFKVAATGTVNIGALGVGGFLFANGNVLIDGGVVQLNNGSFGVAGGKTVTIQNGGRLSANFYSTSNATYNVTGNNSKLETLSFSDLNITSGAQVNVNLGGLISVAGNANIGTTGNGTLTVDGAGSGATLTANNLSVASDGNTGTATFKNNAVGNVGIVRINVLGNPGTTGALNVQSGADLTASAVIIGASSSPTANATITVDGAGSTLVQSGAAALSVGNPSDGSAILNVNNGASFTAGSSINVQGTGTISINNGTFVTGNPGTGIGVGGGSATIANITVVGPSGQFTETGFGSLTVGNFGIGTINVGTSTTGGTFTTGTGPITITATGTVNIGSGANTGAFNVNGDLLIDGGTLLRNNAGSTFALAGGRALTVQNGGVAAFSGAYTTTGGTYRITGASSRLTAGAVNVRNGATVNVQAGGLLSSTSVINIGDSLTSGTVNADGTGASVQTAEDTSLIGGGGQTGILTLTNNAQGTFGVLDLASGNTPNTVGTVSVQSGADLNLLSIRLLAANNTAGSSSSFTVGGSGSTVTSGAPFTLQVGENSTPAGIPNATLTITSGGAFTHGTTTINGRGLIDIAGGTFVATGDIFVNGGQLTREAAAGSTFTWTAGKTMTIQNGGKATINSGFSTPSNSTINVSGVGSTLTLPTGNLLLANGAQTTVSLGGTVSAVSGTNGFIDIVNGTLSVSGAGSSITAAATTTSIWGGSGGAASVTLSDFATGSWVGGLQLMADGTAGSSAHLVVQSSASLSVGDLKLAGVVNANATADITLTGTGSAVNLAGGKTFTFGASSGNNATLSVTGGSFIVGAGGSTTMNSTARLVIDHGTVDLKTLTYNGGNVSLGAGSLSFIGNLTVGVGGLLGTDLSLETGTALTLSGTTTIDSSSSLMLGGGSLSTGALVVNGSLAFKSGTLSVTGAGGLTFGSGGPFGSTFELASGDKLNVTNATTINSGALLILDSGSNFSSGSVVNNGEFDLNGLAAVAAGGTVSNTGLIRGEGRFTSLVTNSFGGEIRAESGKRVKFQGANGANAGKINLQGGTAEFSQPLSNTGNGLIAGRGTLITGGTGLLNQANVSLSSGISDIFGKVNNSTGSATKGVTVSGNADVTFWDDVTNGAGSLFRVSSGSSATFFGTYAGAGITGGGQVYFEADVTPGFSPASVTFGGNLTFESTSTLHIDIGGTTPGSGPNNHDQLNIAGAATLGGTLDLVPFAGFVPTAGDKFVVMTYASAIGTFGSVTGTTPAPGLTYTPVYSPTNLTIITTNSGEKTWDIDASGNSSVGANWSGGTAPGGIGDSAAFTTAITANRIVTFDAPTTVGTLRFDDDNNYALVGGSTLTLQNSGSVPATITVQNVHGNGAHSISAPISLASDVNIVQDSTGAFILSGPIDNSAGQAITKSGSGTVEIAAAPNFGDGTAVTVNAGTLRFAATAGTPTIGAAVSVAVNGSATLELAGTASALAGGANRADVVNNSASTAGLLANGSNQIVGAIDGTGTTQISAGSDLTANHIVQGVLAIGGDPTHPGVVVIAASDSAGNPLNVTAGVLTGLSGNDAVIAGSSIPLGSITTGGFNLGQLAPISSFEATGTLGGRIPLATAAAVPEPATAALAALGCIVTVFLMRKPPARRLPSISSMR